MAWEAIMTRSVSRLRAYSSAQSRDKFPPPQCVPQGSGRGIVAAQEAL